MNPRNIRIFLAIAIAVSVIACSVLKKDNHEKEVREFLVEFQNSLSSPATDILRKYFHSNQPRETLIAALRVLQNKGDSVKVICNAGFSLASITFYQETIMVTVPVSFDAEISEDEHTPLTTELVLWLVPDDSQFLISKIDGDKFYQTYTGVRNASLWGAERKLELEKRAPFYAAAAGLQQTFDTVVWYAEYKGQPVFYAVDGEWVNFFNGEEEPDIESYNMGMVNAKGDTLIPFEYDLIGTIAFDHPGLVEVKRDKKYGVFNLDSGRLLVEPLYEMIIPYDSEEENSWALVIKDSVYGWLDRDLQFKEGYPSEAALSYVQNFKYLNRKVVLKAGNQIFCEIPLSSHAGEGIIIPPSYFVMNRLFTPIVAGINTTKVPMNGWTDSIEKNSMFSRIGDNVRAFINVVSERYLGGREEFYGESEVTFMDEKDQVLAMTTMPTDQEIVFSHVDDYTIELMATSTGYYYYVPGNERDIPVYKYFRMDNDAKLVELPSNRIFTFTEYVRIDSSYLEGPFTRYAPPVEEESFEEYAPEEVAEEPSTEESEAVAQETQNETGETVDEYPVGEDTDYVEEYEEDSYDPSDYETLDFLTLPTVQFMRDEILASYGVRPSNIESLNRMENHGYNFKYNAITEVQDKITEIDQHNLDFLERVIALMSEAEMVY